MRIATTAIILLSLSQTTSCSSTGGSAGTGTNGDGTTGAGDPTNGAGPNASANQPGSDAGAPSTCTASCSDDAGGTPNPDGGPALPSLSLVTAHQSGRAGEDVVLTIEGSDPNQAAYAMEIALADATNAPVQAFKSWSGVPTTAKRVVLFDTESARGTTDFKRTVTLHGFMRDNPTLRNVTGAIVADAGHSNPMTTTIGLQTVRNLGQSCDPSLLNDRCAPGLACPTDTKKCATPTPPELTQFAYLSRESGAEMLFAGAAPADDLTGLHLEFLDETGAPVQIDMTGTQDYKTSFDLPVLGASSHGEFFYAVQSAPAFSALVTQLAATPLGKSGQGTRVFSVLSAPSPAATGAACDLRGFATCSAEDSCIAGACVSTMAAITSAATKAMTVDPAKRKDATGYARGATLWGDPPSDCIPAGAHDLPEGAITLHLAHGTQSLTLTTDREETTGKAALFVLPGAGANVDRNAPLGCVSGYPATLTLSNVPSGDYTVVVAAWNAQGANFGLLLK
ncbi:MAG: hypothetical protein U0235_07230 [Polyangiaceae bacterium]